MCPQVGPRATGGLLKEKQREPAHFLARRKLAANYPACFGSLALDTGPLKSCARRPTPG